jgi:hypothetical protein
VSVKYSFYMNYYEKYSTFRQLRKYYLMYYEHI